MKKPKTRFANNENQKEDLIDRFDRTLEWIRACDTKSSILLAGIGIMLTILTTDPFIKKYTDIYSFFRTDAVFWTGVLYLLIVIFFLGCIIVSIGYLILELNPSLISKKNDNQTTDSLYFFGTIAKKDRNQFKSEYLSLNSMSDIDDLLTEIHINAQICNFKYKCTKKGLVLATVGFFGIIVMLVIGLFTLNLK